MNDPRPADDRPAEPDPAILGTDSGRDASAHGQPVVPSESEPANTLGANAPAPDVDSNGGKPSPVHIVLRSQRSQRGQGKSFSGDSPNEVLRRVLEADVSEFVFPIIEILVGEITFLDIDTHDWPEPPEASLLEAYAASVDPAPGVWWITHGQGLRLVFIGPGPTPGRCTGTLRRTTLS